MARFLFVTWNGGGNQPPEIGTAQALREHGHEVVFAGYESQQPRFTGLGFRFVNLARAQVAWQQEEPPESLLAALIAGVWACPEHLRDLPDLLAREPYDVVVVDCLMLGALAAVEDVSIPVAVLVHSSPGLLVPPGGGLERLLLGPLNEVRAEGGLAAVNNIWEAWAHFPSLCATIPDLDPLATQVPASFEYVGPAFERVPLSGWRAPWPADDSRPLVLVSFSTGRAWNQTSRIQRTLEALSGSGCRVLVTSGQADVTGLTLPENAVLAQQVPHEEVLADVAVTVTHAGHGTVVAALAHGVPLVCLPNLTSDQPGLAAQVAALGAGLALDGELATAADIAGAVEKILTDGSYAASAGRLAEVIAATPGAQRGASRLERLVEGSRISG